MIKFYNLKEQLVYGSLNEFLEATQVKSLSELYENNIASQYHIFSFSHKRFISLSEISLYELQARCEFIETLETEIFSDSGEVVELPIVKSIRNIYSNLNPESWSIVCDEMYSIACKKLKAHKFLIELLKEKNTMESNDELLSNVFAVERAGVA